MIIGSLLYCAAFGAYIEKGFEFYPTNLNSFFAMLKINKLQAIKTYSKLVVANFRAFFSYRSSTTLEIFQRYVILFFILCILIILVENCMKFRNQKKQELFADICRCIFHLYNLIAIIGINIVFYAIGGYCDFRVIAPHFLLSVLMELAFLQYAFIKQVLAVNMVSCFLFLQVYASAMPANFLIVQTLPSINLSNYIKVENSPNPWTNTLLVSMNLYTSDLITLPEGIGANIFIADYDSTA
jgi:hypothetical protein